MANFHAGYMGSAYIGAIGKTIRFTDGNIVAKQGVNIPDAVMASYDKQLFNYEKVDISGNISGPVTETFASADGLLKWAVGRDSCGLLTPTDITMKYYCDASDSGAKSQAFTGLFANNVSFNCTAGDVAQFTVDLVGTDAAPFESSDPDANNVSEKLLTWDKVQLSITPSEGGEEIPVNFQSLEFSVANAVEPVYAIKSTASDLFPAGVVPGIRTITGSFTAFNVPRFLGADTWDSYAGASGHGKVTFNIGDLSVSINCRFKRVEPKMSTGLITSTIGFVGVGEQTGDLWTTA